MGISCEQWWSLISKCEQGLIYYEKNGDNGLVVINKYDQGLVAVNNGDWGLIVSNSAQWFVEANIWWSENKKTFVNEWKVIKQDIKSHII